MGYIQRGYVRRTYVRGLHPAGRTREAVVRRLRLVVSIRIEKTAQVSVRSQVPDRRTNSVWNPFTKAAERHWRQTTNLMPVVRELTDLPPIVTWASFARRGTRIPCGLLVSRGE